MATIKPFRGLRYNQDIIKDYSLVVTPPYDVISSHEQEEYYQLHPNNIIRLDFGKDLPGDNEEKNKYTRAAGLLNNWRETGVLKQEAAPAIYIYDQEYTYEGEKYIRRGFISLVKLEPFDKGFIYPHEQTMPGPKADRLELIRSCQANLSSIFALFTDEEDETDEYLMKMTGAKSPEVDFVDMNGVRNKLWAVTEKSAINTLITLMKDKPLFIADGHHRYETSLAYKEQMHRESGMQHKELPCDYVMMVCVSMDNPGLQIFPFHRMVRSIKEFSTKRINRSLEDFFQVEYLGKECNLSGIKQQLNSNGKGVHKFAMYSGEEDAYYLLQLKNEKVLDQVFDCDDPEWRNIDAGIFQTIIINKILGIKSEKSPDEKVIDYVKEAEEAIKTVKSGKYQLAFILRPTLIEQVKEIAMKRKVMPPKSTNFYPKLITGVVINSFT